MFTAGVPKVLFYTIKQYYKGGKITTTKLIRVYVKFFIFSHARYFLYILFILFVFPYISAFICSYFETVSPILEYIKSVNFLYNPLITHLANNPTFTSITFQLAMFTHSINFEIQSIQRLNNRFENQFDRARESGLNTDIALARRLRFEIWTKLGGIWSNIGARDRLIDTGLALRPNGHYSSFSAITENEQSILNDSWTYATRNNWNI